MAGESVTLQNDLTEHVATSAQNRSSPDGCVTFVFSEMEFLPWDNPQNIVSAQGRAFVSQLHNNVVVFLFLIGGPANVINMAVFSKQGLKDRVNLCLFALSLADELYLVNGFLHHFEQVYIQFTTKERFGPISTAITNAHLFFLSGFYYVSFMMSAIIATERCLCVYNPLKFRTLLSTKTMAGIITCVYIVVIGLYFIVGFRYRIGCFYDPVTDITVITAVEGEFYREHKQLVSSLESFVFGVGLPGVVVIVVMTATIMTTVKLRQVLKWRSEMSSSMSAQELAVTKTLLTSSTFFIICMIPGAVSRFSWLFFPEINSGRRNHNFFLTNVWINEMLMFTNSSFNIFVYYSMGSRYRETLWALFGKKSLPGRKSVAPTKPL